MPMLLEREAHLRALDEALAATGRLTVKNFRLPSVREPIQQSSTYYTSAEWRRVLGWYARSFDVSVDRRPRLKGDCFLLTTTEALLGARQAFRVTLCSVAQRTTLFVSRVIAWS